MPATASPSSASQQCDSAWRSYNPVMRGVIWLVGIYAILAGVLTMCGWAFHMPRLTDWRNDGISMFPNTALCAVLGGLSLILLVRDVGRASRIVARVAAASLMLIAGLTLFQHLTGVNLGIDTLLFHKSWGEKAAASPMRMGPPASISFLVLGLALWFISGRGKYRYFASILAVLPLAISALSLVGYLYGADQLFGVARFTGIAWQTSTVVAALAIGTLLAVPEYGVAAALQRRDAGGAVLRRLILPVIMVPLLLGWLRILGQQASLYDPAFGTALRSLVEVMLFLALAWWTSTSLSQIVRSAQASQARLAEIVESSNDAIIRESLDGTIESWNAGAERLFGYTQAEAVGRHISLIIPADRTAEIATLFDRLRRGERIDNFDTVRVHKNGTHLNVSLTLSPVRDDAGRIVGASKIAHDITQRKESEDVLRRNEAELRTLADSIPQLVWIADSQGQILWCNDRWTQYSGRSLPQLLQTGWHSTIDPASLPQLLVQWKAAIAAGEPFELQLPIRDAAGVSRWFLTRVNPLHDEHQQIERWFGTSTDVNEVKRVEGELRERTRVLELLNKTGKVVGSTLDLHPLLQAVTDLSTEISGAKFGAFFYNTTDENGDAFLLYTLSGAPREAFEKFGRPRATPLFASTFNGEAPIRCEDVLADPRYGKMAPHHGMPKGHLTVRSYLAVPVVLRTGEVIGGLFFGHPEPGVFSEGDERVLVGVASQAATAIDNARLYENLKKAASERQHLLEAEREARSEAERVSVMKDEFLATLSHELRTPLNAILGWSQLLVMGKAQPEDLSQGLEAIERNARVQTQLIEDLLDMSRIISGKVRLDVQLTDLAKVVDQAVESLRPSADAKSIRLLKIVDPHCGHVSGDPTRLQQVVWNLLTNAVKFTPKGGKIDILLERVNSHVEITVRDSGIGIKPEFLPLVFERFRQADASTTRSYGGLGLGLSIVKNLVELHGGTVRVDSAGEGQGSTFVVMLPLTPIRVATGREHPTVPSPFVADGKKVDLAGVKVLVIDDETDARDLLKRILGESAADVFTADSADEGLAIVRHQRPHVVVSDIGMPGMDGYEFVRALRQLPSQDGGDTPAIALTAFARSEDRTRAMLAGYQVHIAKPIEPRELMATVASLAGRI